MLGLDFLSGHQSDGKGNSFSGLKLGGGLLDLRGESSQLSLLGTDIWAGSGTRSDGSWKAGVLGDIELFSGQTPSWFLGGKANLLRADAAATAWSGTKNAALSAWSWLTGD